MALTDAERRQHTRFKTSLTSICLKRESVPQRFEMDVVSIKNISLGGVYLKTDMPYPKDTLVDLQFMLTDHPKPVTVKGKICWSRVAHEEPGMGAQFMSMSQHDKQALTTYIASLA